MHNLVIVLLTVAALAVAFILFVFGAWVGWRLCESDVVQRLTGELPVDAYWRKRGMTNFQ